MTRGLNWSDYEDTLARDRNLPAAIVGERIGRSAKAVFARRAYLALMQRLGEERARTIFNQRKAGGKTGGFIFRPEHYDEQLPIPHADRRPCPQALADRDARLALPLTLSQILLGDPEPGRSALDRINRNIDSAIQQQASKG